VIQREDKMKVNGFISPPAKEPCGERVRVILYSYYALYMYYTYMYCVCMPRSFE